MDIMDLAKQLGEGIRESDEMKNLKKYEIDIENDSNAKLLLNDYKLLQAELIKASRQKKDPEIVDSIKRMLEDKENELNNYEVTKNFIIAREKFDKLMKAVNSVVIYSITGEAGCSSDGCSTCDGCK